MTKALTKDLLADTSHHRLEMLIDDRGIDLAIFAPAEDASLIYRRVDFDTAAPSTFAALEDTVYDNPLLLSQFRQVDCLIDTRRFVILPADKADSAHDILSSLYGADDSFEVICDTLDASGATLAAAVSRNTLSFLRRTFNNPRISHRLTPLCRYFGHRTRFGNSGKLHIHLRDGLCDIIAFSGETLLMANTFDTPTVSDTAYFALACAENLEFDPECDRILLSGDISGREELTATLRRYFTYIMPMIFPSQMHRIGRDAMSAPFELVAIHLA